MNNFSSLIDQIRDPLQMILMDCRAIGALISREEAFEFEMEKTLSDCSRLFNIVNTFLSFHIFKDGQVRVDGSGNQFDANAKKFFLESFIQGCVSFRASLVTFLCTSRSIDQLTSKHNRTLYSLLRSKLFSNLMMVTDSARSLVRTCEVTTTNSNIGGDGGEGYTSESVSIISSNFLVQMKALTETTSTFPSRDIFDMVKVNYTKTYNAFLELLRSCVFDISQHTAKLSQYCDEILATSTMLYERAPEIAGSFLHIQGNNTLETNVFSLVDTIKKIFPIISQSVNRIPSSYPLPTVIPLIDLNNEEEIATEKQRKKDFDIAIHEVQVEQLTIDEKKEEQEEMEREKEREKERERKRAILQDSSIPTIKIESIQEGLVDNQSNNNNNIRNSGDSSLGVSGSSPASNSGQSSPSPTRWGIDLPTIVLSDLSDDEDDAPMIWSVPVNSFSSDPFNSNNSNGNQSSSNGNNSPSPSTTPNDPSPRNSVSMQPTKVYNSKDFDINNLNGSKKGSKIGSIFKNPFKSSSSGKDKDKATKSSSASGSPPGTLSPPGSASSSSSPQLSAAGSAGASPNLNGMGSESYKSHSSPTLKPLLNNNNNKSSTTTTSSTTPPTTLVLINNTNNNNKSPFDEEDDVDADTLEIPVGLRGSVCDPAVVLFDQCKDYFVEEIGNKSKRYSNTGVVVGFDHNERHIAHYANYFYQQDHNNYLCRINELGGNVIISIKKEAERGDNEKQHRCLILTSNGLEKLLIYSANNKDGNLIKGIQNYLKPICSIPSSSFKLAKTDKISPHLLSFEKNELTTKYHFYLIFHGEGMTSEKDMLSNERVSKEFTDFYNFLGKVYPIKGWKKYAGGMDTTGNVDGESIVHCETSAGIEVVLHVANLIPAARRKDLMAKNTIVIVYQEGKQSLNPSIFTSLKNQIIFNVRKVKVDPQSVYYKLGVSSHQTISPFGPSIQSPPYYKKDNHFKQFLLTKLINGENSVYSTSLLNQSLSNYRAQKIEEIIVSL